MSDYVMNKIHSFVNEREDIRGAILKGSRCNPNAPIDEYQDYDVLLVVKEPSVYLKDQSWITEFGEILIMQVNPSDGEELFYGKKSEALSFLMEFKEGFRIDFGFSTTNDYNKFIKDSLNKVLIDKDHILPKLKEPSDESYLVTKPKEEEYDFVVNEFWWCMTYVAKGIARNEFPYVKGMYEMVIRRPYMKMIYWYIGMNYEWKVNVGKFGKWIKNFLPKELYELYLKSYSGNDYNEIWDSLFNAAKLFRQIGEEVSSKLNFVYPIKYDENVVSYLKMVRSKINATNN